MVGYLVHGDGEGLLVYQHMGNVVGRGLSALMIENLERLEADGEGKLVLLEVGRQVVGGDLSFAQEDDASLCREMGQQRSCQDDDKRQMERHHRGTAHLPLDEIEDGKAREQCPQG